jgi:hypothetical protein
MLVGLLAAAIVKIGFFASVCQDFSPGLPIIGN